jgi:hypothetical protein
MQTRVLRLGLLGITPLAAATALMGAALLASPTPQSKAAQFPISLFEQAKEEDFIDETACVACHAKAHENFQPSPHKSFSGNPKLARDKQGCQSCHGPGGPHVESLEKEGELYKHIISYSRVTASQASAACMRCHNDTMTLAHFRRTGHGRANVSCVDCHAIHQDGPT